MMRQSASATILPSSRPIKAALVKPSGEPTKSQEDLDARRSATRLQGDHRADGR